MSIPPAINGYPLLIHHFITDFAMSQVPISHQTFKTITVHDPTRQQEPPQARPKEYFSGISCEIFKKVSRLCPVFFLRPYALVKIIPFASKHWR
jgi:hypothetical protein